MNRTALLFVLGVAAWGCDTSRDDAGTGGGAGLGGAPASAGAAGIAGAGGKGASGTAGVGSGGAAGAAGASAGRGGAGTPAGVSGASGSAGPSAAGGLAGGGKGGSAGGAGSAGRPGGASGAGGQSETGGAAGAAGASGGQSGGNDYDDAVLADGPVLYLAMTESSTEPDLSGNGHDGTYRGGAPGSATLPNGDRAADFDGASQYLTVASDASFSIPTTGNLTWEAWIRPDVLQFPNDSGGYVDWMGKCADYSPTCEWEARMYNTTNGEGRCNRISAYVFNPSAGLGSAADWQPTCGLIMAGSWYHVVGEYTTHSQPSSCTNTAQYPGSIEIWVNGVKWNQARHNPTGCMSQYNVVPAANDSPLNIGTMAGDAWFQGAIAKVALYDVLLTAEDVARHYELMTGTQPTGSCASDCSF